MTGDIVGITTLYIKGGENLNFASPINDIKQLLLAKLSKLREFPNEPEPVQAQATEPKPRSPVGSTTLSETLQWLSGASEEESADEQGLCNIKFESNGRASCSVTITETRRNAGPDFWIKESFSLADIDPADIQVEDLGQGEFSVRFHTTNYRKRIIHSSKGPFWPGGPTLAKPDQIPTSDYSFFTNYWFAPRFAKTFKRAVELCGGQRSSL